MSQIHLRHIRFVTGTVRPGKKPIQYVLAPDHVGVASIVTPLAQEHLSRPVSPIGMTTCWTYLTGVLRSHRLEMNTVHFTGLLKPRQPVPICPSTDRTTNIFTQSPFESSFIVHVLKSFYDYTIHVFEMFNDFLDHFIHALFKGSTSSFLPIGAMLTSFDPFYDWLDVQAELVPGIGRGQGIDSCINANGRGLTTFSSCFYFKDELNIFFSDYIGIKLFSLC